MVLDALDKWQVHLLSNRHQVLLNPIVEEEEEEESDLSDPNLDLPPPMPDIPPPAQVGFASAPKEEEEDPEPAPQGLPTAVTPRRSTRLITPAVYNEDVLAALAQGGGHTKEELLVDEDDSRDDEKQAAPGRRRPRFRPRPAGPTFQIEADDDSSDTDIETVTHHRPKSDKKEYGFGSALLLFFVLVTAAYVAP